MSFTLDFFEALRRMKARRETADAVAEKTQTQTVPAITAMPGSHSGRIGPAGLALIKRFEGCAKKRSDGAFEAYPDPGTGGDPWTIGWGATGKGITRGTVWTQAECDARLETDLIRFAREVVRAIGTSPTSQNQFDALLSFHYNTGAIARATLTKLHKAGQFDAAAREFGKWVHAGGRRLSGLVRRREAEEALYKRS
ncbi:MULTISPECIES: lysozyme [unclassified Novosphingobium]|uniref:lysozyme n=1 Tax=unclassified Novosphingobium TaxID=2644732 RepID=UPI0025DB3D73|nr:MULTISPECIES: lysozyme [unclassified Novosphingobium]HQV03389.1 lysozyme [Novosphingobium sp.]